MGWLRKGCLLDATERSPFPETAVVGGGCALHGQWRMGIRKQAENPGENPVHNVGRIEEVFLHPSDERPEIEDGFLKQMVILILAAGLFDTQALTWNLGLLRSARVPRSLGSSRTSPSLRYLGTVHKYHG